MLAPSVFQRKDAETQSRQKGRILDPMRYLVTARVKPGREQALAQAIEDGTLGDGSIAGGEYQRNMESARRLRDGSVKWVEVCYCATPLDETRIAARHVGAVVFGLSLTRKLCGSASLR